MLVPEQSPISHICVAPQVSSYQEWVEQDTEQRLGTRGGINCRAWVAQKKGMSPTLSFQYGHVRPLVCELPINGV